MIRIIIIYKLKVIGHFLKYKLNNNLKDKPLFNTKKYVDNLEKAYSLAFDNKNNNNKITNIVV